MAKVNTIGLCVRNLEACTDFYKEKLGLKVKETDEGYVAFDLEGDQDLALMSLDLASQMIDEATVEPDKQGPHRTLLAMFVDDTDKTYDDLRSKGVEFIKVPTTQPWGQRTAYFKDPEGNVWEIAHFVPEKK